MAIDGTTLDVLKEIGNIGAGNAATALATMLDDKINIGLPTCEMLPFSEITRGFASPEELVVGTLVQMSGDMEGFILMLMKLDAAMELLTQLTGEAPRADVTDYPALCEALSPVSEVGNILIGSYLSAISSMTGMSIMPSVPAVSVDMVMALMNVPVVVYGEMGETVLFMETDFHSEVSTVKGQYFLIPTMESSERLLRALGM
ncbi:chemotaxis protein CheC [Christensenellaceae bacterium OttesenSCG-928-L17]|nr:chemotaxis protein CheC [Christensenellaceae bacterium OttesenSCG-928-L17]